MGIEEERAGIVFSQQVGDFIPQAAGNDLEHVAQEQHLDASEGLIGMLSIQLQEQVHGVDQIGIDLGYVVDHDRLEAIEKGLLVRIGYLLNVALREQALRQVEEGADRLAFPYQGALG